MTLKFFSAGPSPKIALHSGRAWLPTLSAAYGSKIKQGVTMWRAKRVGFCAPFWQWPVFSAHFATFDDARNLPHAPDAQSCNGSCNYRPLATLCSLESQDGMIFWSNGGQKGIRPKTVYKQAFFQTFWPITQKPSERWTWYFQTSMAPPGGSFKMISGQIWDAFFFFFSPTKHRLFHCWQMLGWTNGLILHMTHVQL